MFRSDLGRQIGIRRLRMDRAERVAALDADGEVCGGEFTKVG